MNELIFYYNEGCFECKPDVIPKCVQIDLKARGGGRCLSKFCGYAAILTKAV